MYNPIRKLVGAACLGSASLLLQTTASGQVLFSDDFQTNSSPAWAAFGISDNGVTNDYSAQFAFDYSIQTYAFNGATLTIPPAPNSGGTSKGLKVTVNKNGNTQKAALSLYPIGKSFSGDYALKFDLWMDYNGDVPFGGVGSTEFATFGLNHLGTQVNWPGITQNGDGDWFAVDAEGGGAPDYYAYAGDLTPGPNTQLTGSAGFLDRDNDGTVESNAPDGTFSPLQYIFRTPTFQTPGAIGKHWVQCEVRQQGGTITWLIDGYIIAQHAPFSGSTSGNIMLGYMDPFFAEIASPPNENYAIFDNVRVIDLTTSNAVPEVSIAATDNDATESGGNPGTFTITRTGDTTNPLTVNLYVTGTASNGVDYATIPLSTVISGGSATKDITVSPINDSIGEPVETVVVALVGNPGIYEIRNNFAVVNLNDDADVPSAKIVATRPSAYENYRVGKFTVTLSNPNAVDTLVNYTISGTATNGIDYVAITNKALVLAGSTNATITIDPINNSKIDAARTITLTITSGTGYALGTPLAATESLLDDDLQPGMLLFGENFESTTSSNNFVVLKTASSDIVSFAYDYAADGIPPAPHTTNGTTLGLKLEANVTAVAAAGLSVFPKNQSFTGDYRMRFDFWINYNGPLFDGGSGSTEFLGAGVGTKGTAVQWANGGAAVDSIWFAVDGDGGNGSDYRAWKNNTHLTALANPGLYAAGAQGVSNPYYASFGGDPAPLSQQSTYPGDQTGTAGVGNPGFAWHDCLITKVGTNVIWTLDGILIANVSSSGFAFSTNVFFCYYDTSSAVSPIAPLAFGLVDNLKVETLSLPRPNITSIKIVGGNVQIDFTGIAADTIASFKIQGSALVTGTYADVAPVANITSLGGAAFRATTPVNGAIRFYRVSR